MLYLYIKTLSRIVLKLFFNKIEINGIENIPKGKQALIFAPNHQNAFLDAVIVGTFVKEPIHYLTRSDVFVPPFKYFLEALYMMPVYRLRDGRSLMSRNEAVFNTCKKILSKRKNLLLFPEANHALDYFLRPLSKGLSRIAYKSQESIDHEIMVIPVGLNYFDHQSSGSKLILNFGKPLKVSQFIQPNLNEVTILKNIRQAVSEAMKETLIIPEDGPHYLAQKAFVNPINENLSFIKLRDKLALVKSKEASVFKREKRKWLELFNWPFFTLVNYVLENKVKDEVFPASIKFAAVLLIFPVYFILLCVLSFSLFNYPFSLILPVISIVTMVLRSRWKILKETNHG